ncbi:MAG: pyruvate formate lyase family protein [bacterium]
MSSAWNIEAAPRRTATDALARLLLRLLATSFNRRPSLNRYLRSAYGWLNFTVGITTESGTVGCAIRFRDGRASVLRSVPADADAAVICKDDRCLRRLLTAAPTEQIRMTMHSDIRVRGNNTIIQLFFFLVSLLLKKTMIRQMAREREIDRKEIGRTCSEPPEDCSRELKERRSCRMRGAQVDPGVKFLDDPYLSMYGRDDFPRLKSGLERHLTRHPEICAELPKLMTDWYRIHGFETDPTGKPWIPVLRQGHAFKHLMENREPVIRQDSLLAGTTTAKDIGCLVKPEGHGTWIWNELFTVPHRTYNPFDLSEETRRILHHEVFPFWIHRNMKEWVRRKYNEPLGLSLDERWAIIFCWGSLNRQNIADFPKILRTGASGIIAEIRGELEAEGLGPDRIATLQAMILALEGLTAYCRSLSRHAARQAEQERDPERRSELERIAAACERVVEMPARTLDEAVQAVWITFVAIHNESVDSGMSLGRLDQWLQPYFEADMLALRSDAERQAYIRHALELIGCLYLNCQDHFPLTPDFANFQDGGSSSVQAITLGGVRPDGADAVNDMTYLFLKVTEMLSMRDPNVNARFHPERNSDTYLKRLCEVNLITSGTPSIHNDLAVMKAWRPFGIPEEDLRNWGVSGCVEVSIMQKHESSTSEIALNLVAPLEMALNNGLHPPTRWKLGPETGSIEEEAFRTFDSFYEAYLRQLRFIIDAAIAYNDMLAEGYAYLRPTPLLSSLVEGCIRKGLDAGLGGAVYNSSGFHFIGLADVVDSLMVIRKLVFDEKACSFAELKRAVDRDFREDAPLLARIRNRVPLFGSGSEEGLSMARRLQRSIQQYLLTKPHNRGGFYTAGYWSMSHHSSYGNLSGAIPSGRCRGKPFTPGLTPQPIASKDLLNNLRDVAKLDPADMPNNMAFNVKVVPQSRAPREKTVGEMAAYVKSFFHLGGMQMQMNAVSTGTLRDAMAHPENYRNLIVRISGYNAYFVTLNRDIQREIIGRSEFGL